MSNEQQLRAALKKLAFAARTSGGTAGPDSELMAACSEAEAALSQPMPEAAARGWKLVDVRALRDIVRDIRQHIEQGALSEALIASQRPGYGTGIYTHIKHKMDDISAMLSASPAAPEGVKVQFKGVDWDGKSPPTYAEFVAQPQAQGEPEVVAYAGNNGIINPTTRGYDVLYVGAELITLQSHREAIAKRDAALLACVEALKSLRDNPNITIWSAGADAAIAQGEAAL